MCNAAAKMDAGRHPETTNNICKLCKALKDEHENSGKLMKRLGIGLEPKVRTPFFTDLYDYRRASGRCGMQAALLAKNKPCGRGKKRKSSTPASTKVDDATAAQDDSSSSSSDSSSSDEESTSTPDPMTGMMDKTLKDNALSSKKETKEWVKNGTRPSVDDLEHQIKNVGDAKKIADTWKKKKKKEKRAAKKAKFGAESASSKTDQTSVAGTDADTSIATTSRGLDFESKEDNPDFCPFKTMQEIALELATKEDLTPTQRFQYLCMFKKAAEAHVQEALTCGNPCMDLYPDKYDAWCDRNVHNRNTTGASRDPHSNRMNRYKTQLEGAGCPMDRSGPKNLPFGPPQGRTIVGGQSGEDDMDGCYAVPLTGSGNLDYTYAQPVASAFRHAQAPAIPFAGRGRGAPFPGGTGPAGPNLNPPRVGFPGGVASPFMQQLGQQKNAADPYYFDTVSYPPNAYPVLSHHPNFTPKAGVGPNRGLANGSCQTQGFPMRQPAFTNPMVMETGMQASFYPQTPGREYGSPAGSDRMPVTCIMPPAQRGRNLQRTFYNVEQANNSSPYGQQGQTSLPQPPSFRPSPALFPQQYAQGQFQGGNHIDNAVWCRPYDMQQAYSPARCCSPGACMGSPCTMQGDLCAKQTLHTLPRSALPPMQVSTGTYNDVTMVDRSTTYDANFGAPQYPPPLPPYMMGGYQQAGAVPYSPMQQPMSPSPYPNNVCIDVNGNLRQVSPCCGCMQTDLGPPSCVQAGKCKNRSVSPCTCNSSACIGVSQQPRIICAEVVDQCCCCRCSACRPNRTWRKCNINHCCCPGVSAGPRNRPTCRRIRTCRKRSTTAITCAGNTIANLYNSPCM